MGTEHLGEPLPPVHSYTEQEGKHMRGERQKDNSNQYKNGYDSIDWSVKVKPVDKDNLETKEATFSKRGWF